MSCFELCFLSGEYPDEILSPMRVPSQHSSQASLEAQSLVLAHRVDAFFVSTDHRELSDFFNSEGELTCKPQWAAFF